MSRDIARLTALVLILIATFSTVHARRVLLRPPDGYKGVEINGVKYVVGQVYVPQFADTTALKSFGFRGFEATGSTVYYKKVTAIWPLDTDIDSLPDFIVGLNYEKVHSEAEMKRVYAQPEGELQTRGGSIFSNYGTYYNGPVSTTYNYGYPGLSSSNNTGAPYCSWENDYNPDAYRYRTTTRTNLKPTTIGSYPDNKFLKRKCDCRGYCTHRGRSSR